MREDGETQYLHYILKTYTGYTIQSYLDSPSLHKTLLFEMVNEDIRREKEARKK